MCGHSIISLPNRPFFRLYLYVFSTTLHTRLGFSHPLILGVSHWICNQPLETMGIHLLCCVHWICTLMDVVVTNPIQIDLVSQVSLFHEVVAIVASQAKDDFYYDQFLVDLLFLLVVEVFRCLHHQVDGFLHWCANMAWGVKGIGGLPLSICAHFMGKRCECHCSGSK